MVAVSLAGILLPPAATAATARAGAGPAVTVLARAPLGSSKLVLPGSRGREIPVRVVGSSGGAIAVPQNAGVVGWWRGSVPFAASRGSSILVGHVSDEADAPGALGGLRRLRRGDRITWSSGSVQKIFRVTRKQYTARSGSLPERIWSKSGRRVLNLVTCARRVTYPGGGYHYTANLTVTARLVAIRLASPGTAHHVDRRAAPAGTHR
ncbi:class F sortase [Pimelobacter sp. 30-1]|uniref:class F sortase n=1 Tax=Pimelobacter sp. 30-1 TaxID=2004991 RepID=UPI001C0509A5|nr:class F sortase [Pimelobacter sp. 30-1]